MPAPTAYSCGAGCVGAGGGVVGGGGAEAPGGGATVDGWPNSCVKYNTPVAVARTLVPTWVRFGLRMFARWPGEFIHAFTTSAAVVYP